MGAYWFRFEKRNVSRHVEDDSWPLITPIKTLTAEDNVISYDFVSRDAEVALAA